MGTHPNGKPASGGLTLIVENAVFKYIPQCIIKLSFDAGENPQAGQIWDIEQEINIAGYKINVTSARAVTFADIQENPGSWDPQGGPDYPEGSQGYDNGYLFSTETESAVSNVMRYKSDSCWLSDVRPAVGPNTILYTQLCRDGYPKGKLNVVINDLSILVKNIGQVILEP